MATDEFTFKINGRLYALTKKAVEAALKNVDPDPVRAHGVKILDRVYPVKQVLSIVTGLDRLDFQTMQARSVLQRLGFHLARFR